MNLDEKLKQYPEAQHIVNLAFQNSKKDGSGREHGELTKKELLSYTKAIERQQSTRIRTLESAASKLVHLHRHGQQDLTSGHPSPEEWADAVNELAGVLDGSVIRREERSQERPDIRHELTVCPNCKGRGWRSEHDPTDPHVYGVCTSCPVQVQCETCEATGIVWKKDLPEPEKEQDDSDPLPF